MSFWAFKRRHKRFARFLMHLSGYEPPLKAWVTVDEDKRIVAQQGLILP